MFIEIPLKSTQKLDISSPLIKYAKKNGHKDKVRDLESILSDITNLRITCQTTKKYINEENITSFLSYHGYASGIIQNFPVLEEKPIGFKVSWSDINNKSWGTTYNFVYEVANILANAAALYTQQACEYLSGQKTVENAGKAALAYENAAKIYKHIHNEVFPSYAQTPMTFDMSESGLCGLQFFCHGLSQLAFCMKAVLMNMNAGVVSALYFGCIELFKEAANHFTNNGNFSEYLVRSRFLVDFCEICGYQALFDFYKDSFEKNTVGSGFCLGISNYCKQLLKNLVAKYDKKTVKMFEEQVLDMNKQVNENYSQALQMSSIKFEIEEDAKSISHQSRVYHKDLEKPNLPTYTISIFDELLPENVKQALTEYREYVTKQLTEKLSKINDATTDLEKKRKELRIWSTVNALSQTIPGDVVDEVEQLRRNNKVCTLLQQFEQFENVVKEAGRAIEATNRTCNQYEARYSGAQLGGIRTKVYHLQGEYELYSAKLTDIKALLEEIEKASTFICPASELQQLLPPCQFSEKCQTAINNLHAISEEIDTLIKDRNRKIEMINAQSKNDTVVRNEFLASQYVQKENCFFTSFAPVSQSINEVGISVQSQETLLSKLQAGVQTFQMYCNEDKDIQARMDFYNNIANTIEKIKMVDNNINMGIAYFQNVLKRAQDIQSDLKLLDTTLPSQTPTFEITPQQSTYHAQMQSYYRSQYQAPEQANEPARATCPTCHIVVEKGVNCPYCSTFVL